MVAVKWIRAKRPGVLIAREGIGVQFAERLQVS